MKRLFQWFSIGLVALGLILLLPVSAYAGTPQDDEEESDKDSEEKSDEEKDAEEGDAEEEETEEEETEEEETTALFGSDDEIVTSEETETEPEPEKVRVLHGEYMKSITFSTDDGWFKFQPRGWVQPRYQLHINGEADDTLAGSGFSLKRARFGFQADMFDFARVYLDTGWSGGYGSLVDFFVDVDPFDGMVALRAGYFRPWFGRQLLMATTQLQMIEYAQAWQDEWLGLDLGRDLGFGLFGMIADTVEYGIGVWNGREGFSLGPRFTDNGVPAPANIDYMFGGRLAVHPLAPAGVGTTLPIGDVSDTAISEKPALSLGVAMLYNKRHDRDIMMPSGVYQLYYDTQLKFGVDLGFKMKGLSVLGEFFLTKVGIQDDADQPIKDAVTLYNESNAIPWNIDGTGIGAYGQVGYFILPRQLEAAVRFDMVDENMDKRGSRLFPGAGLTYYFFGNNLKAQLMYRINVGTGYEEVDPTTGVPDAGYVDTTHDIFLMLQAAI